MPTRINVRKLREGMGLSVEAMADKLGVHWRSIYRWENGDVDPSPLAQARLRAIQESAGTLDAAPPTGPRRCRPELNHEPEPRF